MVDSKTSPVTSQSPWRLCNLIIAYSFFVHLCVYTVIRRQLINKLLNCYTVSHVLTNVNVGDPTEIVYNLFCTNYEILLPTAG